MKLTLIARCDTTGLGYQTLAYYKHLKPNKVVLIDLSPLNGNPQNYDWYENAHLIKGLPKEHQLRDLLSDTDVLLTAETPYNLNLYKVAREMGVKTVCVENPEFYDHIKYPEYELPDLIILPSVWRQKEIEHHANSRGTKVIQLHHPVDRTDIPYRKRTTHRFMHIAGTPAANDRNGTWEFLQACPEGIVTTQSGALARHIRARYPQSRVLTNINDHKQLYELGDILVLPRKYGGNCLPLNEALASGMPVIMPDISPNNHILPSEWLVKATVTGHFEPRTPIEMYTTDTGQLRDKLHWLQSQDIGALSEQASRIADSISWETLLPKWEKALYELA